ncbi:MAG: metallophosphatase family protein [Syntrophorhabdaceae bacterium]|nr:metallophosphatase family protein [Syntrophorhabdaceae bacterium]
MFLYKVITIMVKVGIISDTHLIEVTDGFKRAIETLFGDINILIHAGDITGIKVFEYLSQWDLKAVRGNMDGPEFHPILPIKRVEVIEGRRIGIMHGSGPPFGLDALIYREFEDVDIIIFGHSHMPFYSKKGNTLMFNPGSFGKPHTPPGTVGIMEIGLDVSFKHIEIREYY